MTKKQANQIMNDTGCKDIVFKILDELNGESYSDAKKILDVINFFISHHAYIDKDMAQSLINADLAGDGDD